MLIDAHCHINSLDTDEVAAFLKGVDEGDLFIDVSIDIGSARRSLLLSDEHPFIYTALGFHPFSVDQYDEATVSEYAALIRESSRVVAIGEVGLDHTASHDTTVQRKILSEFILLARREKLPLILHNRRDDGLIFEILDEQLPDYRNVVFHCFSQGTETVRRILDKGGFISYSLNVLRDKKKIRDSLIATPLEHLLLETDSPYMKIRDEYSNPLDIEKVYVYAARVKGVEAAELEEVISHNTEKLFKIP